MGVAIRVTTFSPDFFVFHRPLHPRSALVIRRVYSLNPATFGTFYFIYNPIRRSQKIDSSFEEYREEP